MAATASAATAPMPAGGLELTLGDRSVIVEIGPGEGAVPLLLRDRAIMVGVDARPAEGAADAARVVGPAIPAAGRSARSAGTGRKTEQQRYPEQRLR